MVITGLVAGSVALALAVGYARWLDDTVIADLVLWILLVELGLGILGYGFLDTTDTALIINVGALSTPNPLPSFNLLLTFDDLSAAL
jgi:hypothetical protein